MMDVGRVSIEEIARRHEIKTVRVSFSDMHGVSRGRHVPIRAFLEMVRSGGMEFSNAIFVMDTSGDIAAGTSIFMGNGFPNWRLVVDEKTFVPIPWRPGEARVLADMVRPDGQAVDVMPRSLVHRQVQRLESLGLRAQATAEYEFYLFRTRQGGGPPEPYVGAVQYNSELKHAQVSHIFEPLVLGLEAQGIQVEAFAQEYSPSQYEVNLHHMPALEAADAAFTFKQAVKEVMHDQGLLASFMSKPLVNANGSGCHVHISLQDQDGGNAFDDPSATDGLSDRGRAFIAGVLQHAPALTALVNPTVNCYKRIVPGRFAPVNATWGYDNRTCLMRVPLSRGAGTHVEFRGPSAVSNPYVVLAALLAAGIDGVERGLDPGAPELGNAYGNSEATPLPSTMEDALDSLLADEVLQERLGSAFTGDFIAIKRHEAARFRTSVTNWEWDEYLDLY